MKKYLIYLIILAISVGLWRGFSSQSNPALTSIETNIDLDVDGDDIDTKTNQVLSADYEKLIKNFKKENIENPNWKDIIDYTKEVKDVVKVENAKAVLELSQANLPDLMACLKKDFCGMTTRGEEDPYFDETATPGHQLARRNLRLMTEAVTKDPSTLALVDWDLIENVALSDSAMLQVEAVKLLNENPEFKDAQKLVELSEHFKGTAKALALVNITHDKKGSVAVAREIQEIFAGRDIDTIISVLEKMNKMNLSQSQISQALKNLCEIKEIDEEAHNWKMIEYLALELDSEFKKYCH